MSLTRVERAGRSLGGSVVGSRGRNGGGGGRSRVERLGGGRRVAGVAGRSVVQQIQRLVRLHTVGTLGSDFSIRKEMDGRCHVSIRKNG